MTTVGTAMKALLLLGIICVAGAVWNAGAVGCSAASSDSVGAVGEQGGRAPDMDGETSVTRACVSAATWKGFMDTHGDDSQHCVWSNQTATAASYSADMSCASGKITGYAVMTIDSPESFHYRMNVEMPKGSEYASYFDITAAKFVDPDCFGLKPGEEIDMWE
ncbi:MAG TPA: DUF3617 family protein [Edaphobacter sp.]